MSNEELLKELREALGPRLKSVVLYGSAAAGDFFEGISGRDVLIVVERLGAGELTALAAPLAHWEAAGNPMPQLFTPEELAGSVDVFPIELMDMRQSRRVLLGDDPLTDLDIDMHLFRIQLERELKTRLLLLRRKYLACGGKKEAVAGLMAASISTFLVLMRAALRLYNEAVPADKSVALEKLNQHIEFERRPFLDVLDMKQRKQKPAAGEIDRLFASYLAAIETVVAAVDKQLHPKST